MASREIMENILKRFDFSDSLRLAFGYGSAVFIQKGNPSGLKGRQNMIDMCFVVDNPIEFHWKNLKKNPNDYSFLGKRGLCTSKAFHRMAAGVYINTLIPVDDVSMFKYGVISSEDMKRDLSTWDTLFYAGRLHKPVKFLTRKDDFNEFLQKNLKMAWNAASLLSDKSRLNVKEVFTHLAGISYHGDFRMIFGEDRHKVERIVHSNLDEFYRLYLPVIQDDPFSTLSKENDCLELDQSLTALRHRLMLLPDRFQAQTDEVAERKSDVSRILRKQLESVVWETSLYQSLKNVPTAGLSKSTVYAFQKLMKMQGSRLKEG